MSNKNFQNFIGITVGIILLILLIKKTNENIQLKKVIEENDNLNDEIKKRLKELIDNNLEVDPRIANELSQIAALLEIKQDNSAVLKLAKIIENLLKELYKDDPELKELAKKNNRKNPVFADYLEFAKIKTLINQEDFHLLSVLKIIRNQEAHELDIKKEKSRLLAAFISAMGLILLLSRTLKKKTIEPKHI
jgi:hypothetical protein